MATLRYETSAESAARFLKAREGRRSRRAKYKAKVARQRRVVLSRLPAAPPERRTQRRIVLDLAEPTLRLIHDVLLDALHAIVDFGDRGALLMIAEQMVAIALGEPPCDDPPLDDREVP
jgi:hypothetical protein